MPDFKTVAQLLQVGEAGLPAIRAPERASLS